MFHWLTTYERLSPAALTVRAQAVSVSDIGRLRHPQLFPRMDTDSIKLSDITIPDFRPVSDRRAWNGKGRQLTLKTGPERGYEIVPVEGYFVIDEYEMQRLAERNGGQEDLVRRALGVTIEQRVEMLPAANLRRIEIEAMEAWSRGQITVRNPEDNTTRVVSLGYAAGRYQTAATAWNGAVNAYDELIAWLRDAQDSIGPIEGVALRRATLTEIEKDAPVSALGYKMLESEIASRIGQVLSTPFRFEIVEDTFDVYSAAGGATTRTKVWPVGRVAVIPAGGRVGHTFYAPVLRAAQLASALPSAQIDVRGTTVFYHLQNDGRELKVEGQVNPLPIPEEQLTFVIDAGI